MNFDPEYQIKVMATETIELMSKNPNIGVSQFFYASDRVESFKTKALKEISRMDADKRQVVKDLGAKLDFIRVFAIGQTKKMNTGEITEG